MAFKTSHARKLLEGRKEIKNKKLEQFHQLLKKGKRNGKASRRCFCLAPKISKNKVQDLCGYWCPESGLRDLDTFWIF